MALKRRGRDRLRYTKVALVSTCRRLASLSSAPSPKTTTPGGRAGKAWARKRDGSATIAQVSRRIGLQDRPTAVLLAVNACLGVLGLEDDRYYIYDVMREMVLEGGQARTVPRPPIRKKTGGIGS